MKLAIVGSREFNDYNLLCSEIAKLKIKPTEIISGGSGGADALAERWSLEFLNRDAIIFQFSLYPNGKDSPPDKGAVLKRNLKIIEASDAMLVFWDSESKGTIININLAISKSKPIKVIHCDWPKSFTRHDILEFDREFRWLSNMWPTRIKIGSSVFFSAESAYQSSKFIHCDRWKHYKTLYGIEAKKQAKKDAELYGISPKFNENKVKNMAKILKAKFSQNIHLMAKLLLTYPYNIVEGNSWGDTYWGVCKERGENKLGILLMHLRDMYLNDVDKLPKEIRWIGYRVQEMRCGENLSNLTEEF